MLPEVPRNPSISRRVASPIASVHHTRRCPRTSLASLILLGERCAS